MAPLVVASAAREHGTAGLVEEVTVDGLSAVAVVEVDALHHHVVLERLAPAWTPLSLAQRHAVLAEMVQVVPAQHVAATPPVAPRVHARAVAGLEHRALDLVVLHEVLVAAVAHRDVGRVVEVVVLHRHAAAAEPQAGPRDAGEAPAVPDVVAVDAMSALRERLAVAAGHVQSRAADLPQTAVPDGHVASAPYADAGAGEPRRLESVKRHVVRSRHVHSRSRGVLELQALQNHVRRVPYAHKRVLRERERDVLEAVRRGIEVERARLAVHVPLPGRVEFLEQVVHEVAGFRLRPFPRLADAVGVDALGGEGPLFGVDLGEAQRVARPVVAPEAEHEHALRDVPAARLVADILESAASHAELPLALLEVLGRHAAVHHVRDLEPAGIRIARDRHGASGRDELHLRPRTELGGKRLQFAHAELREVA